jgi:hypothetical protein
LKQIALVREARKRAAAERNNVAFTRLRREEDELREALRLLEARAPTTYGFDPKLHPRNRLVQFTDVLTSLRKQVRGSEAALPHGVVVRRRGGTYDVRVGKKRVGTHLKPEKAARAALGAYEEAEAAAPRTERKYPDIAHLRRLGDEMGLFAEKPEGFQPGDRVTHMSGAHGTVDGPEQGGKTPIRWDGGRWDGTSFRGAASREYVQTRNLYPEGGERRKGAWAEKPEGMAVEKAPVGDVDWRTPEELRDKEPEVGERVIVLPENPAATFKRGRLRARDDGQATVQIVGNTGTFEYPSERVIYGGPGVEKPDSESDPVGQVLTLGIGGKFTLRGKRYTLRDFGNWTHGHGYSIAPVWNEKGRSTTVKIKEADKITDLDDSGGWHPWMGSDRPRR